MQKFSGRPVAVLGVSADESRERLKVFLEKEKLPWPSWYDGAGGPIAAIWGVERFPTVFVIDARGQVRYKHAGVPPAGEVEKKVEELLKEDPTKK